MKAAIAIFVAACALFLARMVFTADPRSELKSEAQNAVREWLVDPDSAKFGRVVIIADKAGDIVCGTVNARNRMGGYAGSAVYAFQRPYTLAVDSGGQGLDLGDTEFVRSHCRR